MVKETNSYKTRYEHKSIPVKEKIIKYTCSDGKVFTNENDDVKGYLTGLELAERHEKNFQNKEKYKKEFLYKDLGEGKNYDLEYPVSFCFTFSKLLSKEAKNVLSQLIYERIDWDKMQEGVYLVEQSVYEIPSSSMCRQYDCDGYFGLLSDKILEVQQELEKYKNYETQG